MEIALSADREEDLVSLEDMFSKCSLYLTIRRQDLIDLLLRERISCFDSNKPPDLIVASYREFFTDLKVVADLKKIPAYHGLRLSL
jgi:hypothetical protein